MTYVREAASAENVGEVTLLHIWSGDEKQTFALTRQALLGMSAALAMAFRDRIAMDEETAAKVVPMPPRPVHVRVVGEVL
jgi:hypothetical protein